MIEFWLELIFFCIFGLLVILWIASKLNLNCLLAIAVYFWHTIFSVLYALFIISSNHGDALMYYHNLRGYQLDYPVIGTQSVVFLTNIIKNIGFSFISTSLFYNLLGSIALLLFYFLYKQLNVFRERLFDYLILVVIFLPSASFWTGGIGKDSVAFLGISLCFLGGCRKKAWIFIIGVTFLFFVRPHISVVVGLSLAFAFIIKYKARLYYKFMFVACMIAVFILVMPVVVKYVGIDLSYGMEGVFEYVSERELKNLEGGGAVDLRQLSPLFKVFTYLFRPLPYEAFSFTSMVASLENVLIISVFLYLAYRWFVKNNAFIKLDYVLLYSLCYSVLSVVILSFTTANLGIAVRQKWMVLPILFYLLFSLAFKKKYVNEDLYNRRTS
jgi:hypothetical protein